MSGIGRTLDVVMLPWQLTSFLPRADLLLIDFSSSEARRVSLVGSNEAVSIANESAHCVVFVLVNSSLADRIPYL